MRGTFGEFLLNEWLMLEGARQPSVRPSIRPSASVGALYSLQPFSGDWRREGRRAGGRDGATLKPTAAGGGRSALIVPAAAAAAVALPFPFPLPLCVATDRRRHGQADAVFEVLCLLCE